MYMLVDTMQCAKNYVSTLCLNRGPRQLAGTTHPGQDV